MFDRILFDVTKSELSSVRVIQKNKVCPKKGRGWKIIVKRENKVEVPEGRNEFIREENRSSKYKSS